MYNHKYNTLVSKHRYKYYKFTYYSSCENVRLSDTC